MSLSLNSTSMYYLNFLNSTLMYYYFSTSIITLVCIIAVIFFKVIKKNETIEIKSNQ